MQIVARDKESGWQKNYDEFKTNALGRLQRNCLELKQSGHSEDEAKMVRLCSNLEHITPEAVKELEDFVDLAYELNPLKAATREEIEALVQSMKKSR
ncbi:MAG: hypothetical protein WAZ18_06390 [Alphaproteobacteria bacterium]